LYYEYYSYVELLIIILVEMLKIFTFFNTICGYENPQVPVYPYRYEYGNDLLPVGRYGAGYGH
jgi:hypothetical protein